MKQYLIDAAVLHGLANTKDKHHPACKKFFQDHSKEELFFSIRCLFELKASRARRLGAGDFSGLPGRFVLKNKKFIDVDHKFFDFCQKTIFLMSSRHLRGLI